MSYYIKALEHVLQHKILGMVLDGCITLTWYKMATFIEENLQLHVATLCKILVCLLIAQIMINKGIAIRTGILGNIEP